MNCTATPPCHQLGNFARKRSILIFLAALIKEKKNYINFHLHRIRKESINRIDIY